MKKLIVLFGILCLTISNVSAQEIATSIKQDDAYRLHASVLPYPGCTYVYFEITGTVTNHILFTNTAGNIRIYGLEVHSMDTVKEGGIFFQNTDNSHFYGGYLATAPSAFGTQLNHPLQGSSLKVTTPGSVTIGIHYKSLAGGW